MVKRVFEAVFVDGLAAREGSSGLTAVVGADAAQGWLVVELADADDELPGFGRALPSLLGACWFVMPSQDVVARSLGCDAFTGTCG